MAIQEIPFTKENVHVSGLDAKLRAILGSKIKGINYALSGVNAGHGAVVCDGLVAGDTAVIASIVANHGTLLTSSDKAQIIAADPPTDTATVTCGDARVQSDANLQVTCWLNGAEYTAPFNEPVSAGAAVVTLATKFTGAYVIEFSRIGNYETGYQMVQAI